MKNIESSTEQDIVETKEKDLMSNMGYISQTCTLITESLQKGCDVMQFANGEILVTGLKPVTIQYSWNREVGKLIRAPLRGTTLKRKAKQLTSASTE